MSDYEPMQAYRHIERTARKTHKCYECDGIIKEGEQYHYHSGVFDGSRCSYHLCNQCETLHNAYDIAFGELFDAIFNGSENPTHMQDFVANADARGSSIIRSWARNKASGKA